MLLEIRHDVYLHRAADDDAMTAILNKLIQGVARMDATLQDLVNKTAEQTGTIDSMKTFIGGLEQAIKDALSGERLSPEAQTKVNQVFAQLSQNTQAVADAIDNDPATPAAPGGGDTGGTGDTGGGTVGGGDAGNGTGMAGDPGARGRR